MRSALVSLLLFLAGPALADEYPTFIIQETGGSYWYCPISAPYCFWYSAFHDRYYCLEFKKYHGKPCDLNDHPVQTISIEEYCKFPPNIDVGFCYERFRIKPQEDQIRTDAGQ